MLITEVCKKCSLTKKAVEYYVEQGLVAPEVQENGYRSFSDLDAERLKKISVLRGLGVSVAEIQKILTDQDTTLNDVSGQKLLEISFLQEKQHLMQELGRTQDWEGVQCRLQQIQQKQSVLERLRDAFPGYYGNYVCQHFAPYLGEPVRTEQQQEAFDTIIAFLDNIHFEIPDDLRNFYEEVTADYDDIACEKISSGVRDAVCDVGRFAEFVDTHREVLESYMAYIRTEDYKKTQAYRLKETLEQFNSASGYNDIFVPAMCRLSSTYREYHAALQRAGEELLQRYPEWGEAAGNEQT